MAIPEITARVSADTSGFESGMERVDQQLGESQRAFSRAEASAESYSSGLTKASSQSTRYAKAAQAGGMQTANLGAQFNDIGVMLAAGQSPLLLAAQQGTQINQVLNTMGTDGRSKVAALGTAFMSIISPSSLLTLGIIAGGAALVQWGMSAFNASRDAETFEDKLESLNELTDRADELTKILSGSVRDLGETYLHAAEATQFFARQQAELLAAQAAERLRDQLSLVNAELAQFTTTNDAVRGSSNALRQSIEAITSQFDVTAGQARILQDEFNALTDAGDFDTQKAALRSILETFEEMEIPLSVLPDELATAVDEMITLIRETDRAKAAMDELAAAAAQMNTGVGLTLDDFAGGGLMPPSEDDDGGGRARSRSGGGSSGVDRVEQQRQQRLEQLVEGLKTEREVLEEWRAEGMELLAEANAQELEVLGGHKEAKLRLEEDYQERIRRIRQMEQQTHLQNLSSMFGNMASIMRAGGEKTTKIAKAFAIAQGLTNSYLAYTQVLADPSLVGQPFMRQALAATTLAAGLAQVANIKSVSSSGGGSGSGGGAGTASAPSVQTQRVDLNIVGGNDRDRMVAQEVISVLNNAQRDGFRLDPRLIGA